MPIADTGDVSSQPLEIQVMDAVAQGVTTSAGLSSALGATSSRVEAAVAWAVDHQMLLRHQMSEGEHLELTEGGLASVAMRRRLDASLGPDGQIDVSVLSRELGVAHQAMQQGQAEELARSQADVLVDDAEREAALSGLSQHFAEGAFDRAELDRRTTLALQARTRGDLHAATSRLDVPAPAPIPVTVSQGRTVVRVHPGAVTIVCVAFGGLVLLWLLQWLLVSLPR